MDQTGFTELSTKRAKNPVRSVLSRPICILKRPSLIIGLLLLISMGAHELGRTLLEFPSFQRAIVEIPDRLWRHYLDIRPQDNRKDLSVYGSRCLCRRKRPACTWKWAWWLALTYSSVSASRDLSCPGQTHSRRWTSPEQETEAEFLKPKKPETSKVIIFRNIELPQRERILFQTMAMTLYIQQLHRLFGFESVTVSGSI